MEPSLREEMTKDIRMDGCSVVMRWGKGLGDIVWHVEQELNRVLNRRNGEDPLAPEGVDIVIQWGGNDVYGEYGYKGFSFHMRNEWVRITDRMHETLQNWEPKARKAVEDAKDALVLLSSRKGVSSVTMVAGPHNGEYYGLPEVYDHEMDRHTEDLKSRGIRIIDPQALILSTERYDMFHMEATYENVKMTTMWYFHVASAIMFERWLTRHAMELKANSRGVLFHNHFHLGLGLEELDIPPTTDLIIPAEAEMVTFPPAAPPVQRYPEEEIVLNQPILSLEKIDELEGVPPIDFVGEVTREAEELTTEDLILRNPNPDEEHLTVETVDPGSLEEQTVLNMIASVDAVMTTQEAENKAVELRITPYVFIEPNVTETSFVDGETTSTMATSKSRRKSGTRAPWLLITVRMIQRIPRGDAAAQFGLPLTSFLMSRAAWAISDSLKWSVYHWGRSFPSTSADMRRKRASRRSSLTRSNLLKSGTSLRRSGNNGRD